LETVFRFIFNRESLKKSIPDIEPPIEISKSLQEFQRDFPEIQKVAFIMMEFQDTKLNQDRRFEEILHTTKKTLAFHGIQGIRADNKLYHPDIFYNVLTYIYGCGFGIAIFDRIPKDEFIVNVSFEVGYMMALRKEVCLLKDSSIPILHTDLIGKLGEPFDAQDLSGTIPKLLTKWLSDKEFIKLQ
jgi:hypothetical protein